MGKTPRRATTARALAALRRAGLLVLSRASGPIVSPSLCETLETRQLLSAAPHRGPLAKLDSTLTSAYEQYQQSGSPASESIQVQAYPIKGYRANLAGAIRSLGSTGITVIDHEVDALIPISDLGKLATLKSLRFAVSPSAIVNTGSVTSQGDTADIAAAARAAYNISGAGVTIGVLSDSFNNNVNKSISDTYSTDVATGDLPANLQDISDNVPGTDEGRAIAQVIYDSAPGATIKFATAESTPAIMAANITALVNAGCSVIIDDVNYKNEPMFEDGVVAQAVEAAIARNVVYIASAGNLASQSYASNWSTGTAYTKNHFSYANGSTGTFYAGTSFNFGSSDMDSFTLGGGQSIDLSLQWDAPYLSAGGAGDTNEQVDVYVLNSSNTIVGASTAGTATISSIGGSGDPIQQLRFTNSGSSSSTYKLLIVAETGTGLVTPTYLKFVDFAGQATNWTDPLNSSTIFGHANAAGVITAGAVNYANTPVFNGGSASKLAVESFSGTGGTPILFNTAGGRLTTSITRLEPVVAGPDNVANTFFGTLNTGSNPTSYAFSGTSAAAASVAGVVALLRSINPSLTPAGVLTALQTQAINIGAAPNFSSGYGFVQTVPSVAVSVGNVSGTIFDDYNSDGLLTTKNGEPGIGKVTVYLDLNNNGILDPGEPTTVSASNGTYTFYNAPTGSVVVRAVTPAAYIPTTAGQAVTIVGAATQPNINLGFFPTVLNATSTAVTLQLDATNPAILHFNLSDVAYTTPIASVPSLTFNLSGGNTSLTANYSNGNPIPAGGVTYEATATSSNNALIINGTSGSDTGDVNFQTTTFDGGAILASGIQSETINGLGGNDTFTVSGEQPGNQSLTFNGGTGNDSLTVNAVLPNSGVGTSFNAGTNPSDQNTLTVNQGCFTFSGDPAATSANLTINDNSQVVFAAGALNSGINQRNITNLNIGTNAAAVLSLPPSHTDREVLITSTLSIASGGYLDLSGNDAIITSGSLATLSTDVGNGFNGGLWNGSSGIQSSAAANDPTHLTAIGILKNNANGTPLFGNGNNMLLFDGIAPSPNAILLKYTYYGDTNLDGVVDGTDYSRTDNGFLNSLTGWNNGDFNYDNTVDGSDYTLLDNAFNTQGTGL